MSGARVQQLLLIGAGGIGSGAIPPLGRAVLAGRALRITVVDPDQVELSNLHRQVIHRTCDSGRDKALSACDALRRLAPTIDARPVLGRLDAGTVAGLLRDVDLVLDGSDNFETRFLVNDACVGARVPFVHAAAIGWRAQLLAVDPRCDHERAPCYRCLFEGPPAPAPGLTCAEAGVVGPVVGVAGALAAELALALLDGESTFTGRLLVYDARAGSTRVVSFRRNPACAACSVARVEQAPVLLEEPGYEAIP